MPLSGNTYVAPNWVDRGPPALDAEELNAISQTLVALQNGEISLQDAVNALTTTVSGKIQVSLGSYIGTGTNTITIPFSNEPYFVVINPDASSSYAAYSLFTVRNGKGSIITGTNSPTGATWSESSVSFSGSAVGGFLNFSGTLYRYALFY